MPRRKRQRSLPVPKLKARVRPNGTRFAVNTFGINEQLFAVTSHPHFDLVHVNMSRMRYWLTQGMKFDSAIYRYTTLHFSKIKFRDFNK